VNRCVFAEFFSESFLCEGFSLQLSGLLMGERPSVLFGVRKQLLGIFGVVLYFALGGSSAAF
jgi:hypothetical protein